jgi:hypothetical protein
MRWFRSNIRVGSRLALMALVVQFVLSFSHVHLSELAFGAANAAATMTAGGAGAATPDKAGAPTQKSDGPSDPGCAICGLIQLAATSTPSAAPALLAPTRLGEDRLEAGEDFALAASPPIRFRARAPPAI